MPEAPAISNWKRRTNIALFIVFFALLWLPMLETIFHFDHSYIPGENRPLAEFPKFKWEWGGLKKFATGLDAYGNDHFGYRNFLIRAYRYASVQILNDQPSQQSVVVGRDGWLYFSDNQMVEHFRGELLFTPEQLADWKNLLEHYRNSLAQRGVHFMFVVAPDKQSIYPEYLPAWMTKISPQTKLDQFFAYMRSNSTVDIVDPRPVLLAGRSNGPTYYQTDSHWNMLGSFLVYQVLVHDLAKHFPGLKPMPIDAFEKTNALSGPGDLIALSGSSTVESNSIILKPKPPAQTYDVEPRPGVYGEPYVSLNSFVDRVAFVYGDSFVNGWVPFLGHDFREVYYFKNDFLAAKFMDRRALDQARPNVVILEIIERSFNVVNARKLLSEEVAN